MTIDGTFGRIETLTVRFGILASEDYGVALRSAGIRRLASRSVSSTDFIVDTVAGSSMARLWRSSGSAVRLCSSQSGSAAGRRNGFGRDALGCVPVVESLVVVVELPQLRFALRHRSAVA